MAIKTITCKKTFKTPSFDELTQINVTIKKGDVIEISACWYEDVYELVSINGNRNHKFLVKNLGGGGNTVTPMIEIYEDEMKAHFVQQSLTYSEFLKVYNQLWDDPGLNHNAIEEMMEKYPDFTERAENEQSQDEECVCITDTVYIR